MSVLIRLKRQKAILRGGQWLTSDPSLEAKLREVTEAWIHETGGPPPNDPDPEYTTAQVVAAELDANIVAHVQANGWDDRRIYHERRQLSIPFPKPH